MMAFGLATRTKVKGGDTAVNLHRAMYGGGLSRPLIGRQIFGAAATRRGPGEQKGTSQVSASVKCDMVMADAVGGGLRPYPLGSAYRGRAEAAILSAAT
jgi:hypothetical protein